MPSRRVSQLKSAPDIRCPSADLQSPFVYFEVATCGFDTPVLGQQAVTTQREVQNAFKSLFADTDNAIDLKNLYVNRLLQHILQPFDRL
jgi:hypothetical protein